MLLCHSLSGGLPCLVSPGDCPIKLCVHSSLYLRRVVGYTIFGCNDGAEGGLWRQRGNALTVGHAMFQLPIVVCQFPQFSVC